MAKLSLMGKKVHCLKQPVRCGTIQLKDKLARDLIHGRQEPCLRDQQLFIFYYISRTQSTQRVKIKNKENSQKDKTFSTYTGNERYQTYHRQ